MAERGKSWLAIDDSAHRNKKTVYTDTHGSTLRERVFSLLDKNHELKPKDIITLLADPDITYKKQGETVRQYRKQWKTEYRNRAALKCLNFHNCRGWIYQLSMMDRSKALGKSAAIKGTKTGLVCWSKSNAKNRMLIFNAKDAIGRVEWFETGRINFWVKKPATWQKVKQLLAYAFSWTNIIPDTQVFQLWSDTAKFKGAHLTVDAGEKLPYLKVDLLKESNGVVVKMGDVSDPTKLEIEFCYPNWMERNERLAETNAKLQEQTSKILQNVAETLKLTSEQQTKFTSMMQDFMQKQESIEQHGKASIDMRRLYE